MSDGAIQRLLTYSSWKPSQSDSYDPSWRVPLYIQEGNSPALINLCALQEKVILFSDAVHLTLFRGFTLFQHFLTFLKAILISYKIESVSTNG